MKTLMIAVLLAVTGCAGAVADQPFDAAAFCLEHPPLGEVGSPICISGMSWAPNGAACCSDNVDMGCVATYIYNGHEVHGPCGQSH